MTARKHPGFCIQEDNINNLKGSYTEIKTDLKGIDKTINGNGDGKGMKTDLALVVQRTEKLESFLEKMDNIKDNNTKILISKISLWVAIAAFIVLFAANIVTWIRDSNFERTWDQSVKNSDPANTTTRSLNNIFPITDTLLSDTIRNDSIR